MKVYLAGRFVLRGELEAYANRLKEDGHEIVSSWVYGGENGMELPQIAELDFSDIDRADTLVHFTAPEGSATPGGGRHVEMGYALGKGKNVIIVGERENVFCWLPAVKRAYSFEALRERIRGK